MINENEFETFIFQVALENAMTYGGKANPKALLGKIMPKFPEMKKDMSHYMQIINNITSQVNDMDNTTQQRKLLDVNPKFLETQAQKKKENKEKKQEGLPELPNIGKNFIGRFAPAPSGYLHIGHALNVVYHHYYKNKYGGKFILRLEDTNPEKIDIKNYDRIIEDVKWLTDDGVNEIYYQSDRVPTYYKYLRQLIETQYAYVCKCPPEVFKEFNDTSHTCPHREVDVEVQLKRYENFFNGKYKDGEAIVRFKGDLQNNNPALRDLPIARLNSTPHARVGTKYKLWPMYNFTVSVDDYLMGINYIVRGKDAEIGAIRQDMIKDALGFAKCPYYHFGLVQFTDIELGKTPIKEKIEQGVYSGWDDPRVPTLVSFRRRGFKAAAFRNMIVAAGISKRGYKLSEKEYFKSINYHNKQILEKEADRYFFVMNPKTVEISNISEYPDKEIVLQKHPDFKDRGYRKMQVTNKYRIDGIDYQNINKGDIIRLMHFANFKVMEKKDDKLKLVYISKEYDKSLKLERNIQYVPHAHGEHKHVSIVMQDNQKIKGMCEALNNPKIGTAIQFERYGFVRLDEIKEDGTRVFYFTHR